MGKKDAGGASGGMDNAQAMDYAQALEYVHGLDRHGWKLGLDSVRALLARVGDPQRGLRAVHVAGTNGKGSTSTFIAGALQAAGYRTGLYTSPCFSSITEYIQIDGVEIPHGEFARLAGTLRSAIAGMAEDGCRCPTEFEAMTAIAFLYFSERGCDAAVLEAGMGGRRDATNVVDGPIATVITTIDYDHMAYLGDTLEKIAYEKGGIMKRGCDAVLYPQPPSVQDVLGLIARDVGAPLRPCDFSTIRSESRTLAGQSFSYKNYDGLQIGMLGDFQLRNAAVAIDAVEAIGRGRDAGLHGIRISEKAMRDGLRIARLPARFEVFRGGPPFIVDAAHNTQGAAALSEALRLYFPGRRFAYVFGMFDDKDHAAVIDATMPLADSVFTVAPSNPRALGSEALACKVRERFGSLHVHACGSVAEAVDLAIARAGRDGLAACAFGSFLLAGAAREHIVKTRLR